MFDTIDKIINAAGAGGPQAIIAILILIIAALLYDRKALVDSIKSKDSKLDKIVEDYYHGNITLAEALNSLKVVLYELRASIK